MSGETYWDLGEVDTVRPSAKSMAAILQAIVRCRGRIHDTHSLELDASGNWRYPTSSCAVLFRISLPDGMANRFMELSGFKIVPAAKVGVN